jgi:hypothetical protein
MEHQQHGVEWQGTPDPRERLVDELRQGSVVD